MGGQVIVGRIKGVERAPLAPLIPTAKGKSLSTPLTPAEIRFSLGTPWIPLEVYQDFMPLPPQC